MPPSSTDGYRRALEHELDVYTRTGREERAAAVRAELARIGHPVAEAKREDMKVAQPKAPRRGRSRGSE